MLAKTLAMSSARRSLGEVGPVLRELREPLDDEGTELRVLVADLPRFLVLIRIAPRLGRVDAVEPINRDARRRRRSLKTNDILPAATRRPPDEVIEA
jgi:hypothetical protein